MLALIESIDVACDPAFEIILTISKLADVMFALKFEISIFAVATLASVFSPLTNKTSIDNCCVAAFDCKPVIVRLAAVTLALIVSIDVDCVDTLLNNVVMFVVAVPKLAYNPGTSSIAVLCIVKSENIRFVLNKKNGPSCSKTATEVLAFIMMLSVVRIAAFPPTTCK